MTEEQKLYPAVAKWLKSRMGCYATGINTGIRYARIDAVGIRDVGGDLSGLSEVIAIEVKRGVTPFSNAVGQAHSYSVYADRCYLADSRAKPYSDEEIRIASHLGVGLLSITTNAKGIRQVREILTAPITRPLEGMRLLVAEQLGYSQCTICSSMFHRGEKGSWSKFVSRSTSRAGAVNRAVQNELGLVYWLDEASSRDPRTSEQIFRRRYVCPDCVRNLFRDSLPAE